MGYPHIRVCGGPRDRGRQYGSQADDRVRRSVGAYREVFADYAGWDWPTVTRQALRFEPPIAAFNPAYLEEMRGIAEGAGVGFEDVLALNVRTEVMFAAKARAAERLGSRASGAGGRDGLPAECTAFALLPAVSSDGHTVIGQNWDWLLHSFDTVVVLEVARDDGPDFVTVVEAGLLAKTGMNSSGVGLVTNALVSDADVGEPGVPYHVTLRAILDAETITDALVAVQGAFRSASANYLVAHADGLAVDLEAVPGDFARLFPLLPSDGLLLHTNHFLSPRFDGRDVSLWVMPDSLFRLERATQAVERAQHPLGAETFMRILADHANYPLGVCCHPDARAGRYDQGATVASVVMDLDARCLWLADGQPCLHPYRRLDYAGLLGKPSPVHRPPDELSLVAG